MIIDQETAFPRHNENSRGIQPPGKPGGDSDLNRESAHSERAIAKYFSGFFWTDFTQPWQQTKIVLPFASTGIAPPIESNGSPVTGQSLCWTMILPDVSEFIPIRELELDE